MSGIPNDWKQDKSPFQHSYAVPQVHQNNTSSYNTDLATAFFDPKTLLQNAFCFRSLNQLSNQPIKQKQQKNQHLKTTQFLYGCYMPPYLSVLSDKLMTKLINQKNNQNNRNTIFGVIMPYKEIIEHENEVFQKWISTLWEDNLKSRRLNVIPHVENYIKSACNSSNSYIKSHYSGAYISKTKIDYNREKDETINTIEMKYCQRIISSNMQYKSNLPIINIIDLESKISFTDGVYSPPNKQPFIQDELCQTLSKNHLSDVSICLSSMKHIMNLEKPNSLWLIPIEIDIDADNCKKMYVGGALSTGHFSQQEKSWYYLRKELKKKFRINPAADDISVQNCEYNYDKWTLTVDGINRDINKTFNLLIRSKPHIQVKTKKNSSMLSEKVLIPKIEYQPEFGFEKDNEEQLVEYWLDTHFRTPNCKIILVSVQYNMDIMMIQQKNSNNNLISDDQQQMCLQRLYQTLDKLSQLGKGEYVMLHNSKKPFEVEIYQSCVYGGFNLLNMYFILQQTEVSDSLTWNSIDPNTVCPIHDHFNVAPCMFKPNPNPFDIDNINQQVNKYKTFKEEQEKQEQIQMAFRQKKKKENRKIKKQKERENDASSETKQ